MAMDTLTETIIEIAGEGDKVLWSGFGTFAIMERAGRRGRNPKTGEEIEIEPRRTLRFRPSKMLEESWR